MRIGLASDTYKPYISGVTIAMNLLKRELERQGHAVYIFSFGTPLKNKTEENVIISPGIQLRMGYQFGLRYSREARAGLESMDIIHIQHPYITGQLVLHAIGKRKPVIFTAHTRYDFLSLDYIPPIFAPVMRSFLHWYFPRFSNRMRRVICNSPASVEAMRNCGVTGPLEIVPNGVDLRPFQQAVRNEDWRNRMGNWPVQLLYTGRLAVEKDLPLLLDAFAILANRREQVGLTLVGGGPMEKTLVEQANRLGLTGRVNFMGLLDYETLPEVTASADLFVIPSQKDTHPLTVIEAMAAGIPPIVVESPAYLGTIENGRDGIHCTADPEALASGIERLVDDGELRRQVGNCARIASQRYSIENTTRQLIRIYSDVLDEGAKRQIL
jgi:1,2-diacylglycerol 3-alpha-glucosyltransferase